MSDQKRRFFSGISIEQALIQAASYHGVDPERIVYRKVEKRHGFLRVRRRVVIDVDPQSPLKPEGAAAPEPPEGKERPAAQEERRASSRPAAAREERGPEGGGEGEPPESGRPESGRPERGGRQAREAREAETEAPPRPRRPARERPEDEEAPARSREPRETPPSMEVAEAAQRALDLVAQLARLRVMAEVRPGEDRLELDLSGPDHDRLVEDEGEILQAMEYLVPRIMRGLAGESVAVRVDSGNFRAEHEAELQARARRAAEEVRRLGRATTLDAMNPAERRIVHLTLADDPEVETESQGEGYFKRVQVVPARPGRR